MLIDGTRKDNEDNNLRSGLSGFSGVFYRPFPEALRPLLLAVIGRAG
jgi:hypothetical protein